MVRAPGWELGGLGWYGWEGPCTNGCWSSGFRAFLPPSETQADASPVAGLGLHWLLWGPVHRVHLDVILGGSPSHPWLLLGPCARLGLESQQGWLLLSLLLLLLLMAPVMLPGEWDLLVVPEAIALWREGGRAVGRPVWPHWAALGPGKMARPTLGPTAFSLASWNKMAQAGGWVLRGARPLPTTQHLALTSSWERWKKRAMSCTRSYLM